MKNRRLTIQLSKTINTGNYGSVKVHSGLSFDIDDSENYDEKHKEGLEQVISDLKEMESMIDEL